MKIQDIISAVDAVSHNTYTNEQKIEWISSLDCKIQEDLIQRYNPGDSTFAPYKNAADRVLLPERYKEMYVYYVCAKIDSYNMEETRAANDMALFNNEYSEFERAYIREHRSPVKRFTV